MAAIAPDEIIRLLDLKPLPVEGGFYAETYRSAASVPPDVDAGRGTSPRLLSTAIYYLLTPDTFSAIHRLPGDEIYHHYLGDPVELLILTPNGTASIVVIGGDIAAGMRPQVVAPGDTWQGSSLLAGGRFALMGTTMSPGYHHDDFELGVREDLERDFPAARDQIRRLTR